MNQIAAVMLCAFWMMTARPAVATDLTAQVPGHPALSWLDLAKLVVPDAAPGANGATGDTIVPFRHINGKSALTAPPDPIDLDAASIEAIEISGRPDRVAALLDLGQAEGFVAEVALLCLFALDGKPRLLDVVEVGNDRWTAIGRATPPLLAPGAPLIEVVSGHTNSNQSYDSHELIFIRGDRFRLIGSVFTMNERYCAFQRMNGMTISVVPGRGPMRAVRVAVRMITTLSGEDCGRDPHPLRASTRIYAGTWHWDTIRGRYVGGSAALRRLEAIEDPSRPR
jgi:hypothetical protein